MDDPPRAPTTPRLPDPASRDIARRIYGEDPAGYDAGRPAYPERVFDLLRTRCGLRSGAQVLEVGPGTGQVTRRLMAVGAHITAVEPDPNLAATLRAALEPEAVSVLEAPFESADLPDGAFDLVVAAMAWHWIDQAVGLPRLHRLLRPGGWVALWWTLFADPTRPDAYRDATAHLVPRPPPRPDDAQPSFELDVDGWRIALVDQAGLTNLMSERIEWSARLDALAVRALHASTIAVRRLPADERQATLDELERIAREDFGGTIERPMVTGFYAARRP